MTTIIWRKLDNWIIQLAWDKRTVYWNNRYTDTSTKVIQLDNFLLWRAWDSMENSLIKEIYTNWKKTYKLWITDIISAINFHTYLKENCNISYEWWPVLSIIIMTKEFQIIINDLWYVNSLEKNNNLLTIWTWSDIVNTAYNLSQEWKTKYELEFNDYFDLVNALDTWTSSSYDVVELLPDFIQTN